MIDLGLVPKFLKYPAEKNSKAQGKVFWVRKSTVPFPGKE
jgi:hypothetical protein